MVLVLVGGACASDCYQHDAPPPILVVGHMRVGVVGGVSVGWDGGMMRQGAGIGHGGSGGHMVGDGRSGVSHQGSGMGHQSGGMVHRGMVDSGAGLVDDGIEAVVVIGGVLHGAHRTIGLHQGVGSLHDIAVAHLMLGLDIAGVRVSHSVVVVVLGVGLGIREEGIEGLEFYKYIFYLS